VNVDELMYVLHSLVVIPALLWNNQDSMVRVGDAPVSRPSTPSAVEELVVIEVARNEYCVAPDGIQQLLVVAGADGSSVTCGCCCMPKPP
jgi:hypothetical protein